MKKISLFIPILVIILAGNFIFSANYSQELQDAYNFAYRHKITTIDNIDNADMDGGLTRIAMAKMLSQYAINILGKTPDTSKIPNFGDVDSKLDEDYNNGVTLAYQLGIMGIGIDEFRPFDDVTRAEFGTALSRVVYGNKFDDGNPYYIKHLDALRAGGIMTHIDQPNQLEIRGYVMLMLMRSYMQSCNTDCEDPLVGSGIMVEKYEINNNFSGQKIITYGSGYKGKGWRDTDIRNGDIIITNKNSTEESRRFVNGFQKQGDTICFDLVDNEGFDGYFSRSYITMTFKIVGTLDKDYIKNLIIYGDGYDRFIPGDELFSKDGEISVSANDNMRGHGCVSRGLRYDNLEHMGETFGLQLEHVDLIHVYSRGSNHYVVYNPNVDMSGYKLYTYSITPRSTNEVTILMKNKGEEIDYTNKRKSPGKDEYQKIAEFTILHGTGNNRVLLNKFTLRNNGNISLDEAIEDLKINIDDRRNHPYEKVNYDFSINRNELSVSNLVYRLNESDKNATITYFEILAKFKDSMFKGEHKLSLYLGGIEDLKIKKADGENPYYNEDGSVFEKYVTRVIGKEIESDYENINQDSQNDDLSSDNNSNNVLSDSDSTGNNILDIDTLNGDNTLNDNDLDNEDNSSEASNNSPNTSNNCVGIEVEDGSSYNFCVSRTYGSKFYMSVDNAGDLDKCVIGKGGQTRDFQTCNGDFTILGGGKSNLTLTIKYNNKSYSKTAYYDLDNGVFVNN